MKISTNAIWVLVARWSGLVTQAAPVMPMHTNQIAHNAASIDNVMPSSFVMNAVTKGIANTPKTGLSLANATGDRHKGLQCGVTAQVGSATDKYESCPNECAFFAQNRKDTQHCTFLCVPAEECEKWNPMKPIADTIKSSRTCRGPKVKFCEEANIDGTDSCAKCQAGFEVNIVDGGCYFSYWTSLMIFTAIVVVIVVIVLTWFIDWCMRETINEEGVKTGEDHRSRAKILMPRDLLEEGEARRTWDPDTNLCKVNPIPGRKGIPAGPGMLLHFNFQAFFIAWPLVVAIIWTVLACFHNELFILGTRKFGTPRHNCILVAWGYETQHRLMWTKNLFLLIVYVFSFITFLLFSVRQLRIYQLLDATVKSMKDFALELDGLPEMPGDAGVEEEIKKAVMAATNATVVGVSVAWNFNECQDEVFEALKKEQIAREIEMDMYTPVEVGDPTAGMSPMKKKLYNMEKSLLGYPDEPEEEPDEKTYNAQLKQKLLEIKSSESAIVVFSTEEEKRSVEKSGEKVLFSYNGQTYECPFHYLECEPATVNWHNFGDTGFNAMLYRLTMAIMKYYVPALAVWFFLFYVPYAASLYNFNYDNGAELPGYYSIIFTMVVVGGNATMYVICDIIGDEMGFKYKDSKQTAYMILYLVACMINVFLDMAVTYATALKVMRGLDFRNYFGVRLDDIHSFTEQFETYAMQRSLAENTYAYAFPSTMLVPFILEPFVTIVVPYYLGRLIVRTHKEVQGPDAEAFLVAFDFDTGRYADILLNVFLSILIFWFPGGYIWSLFYGMCFSHIVIYAFDHYRVLNVIPTIRIVSKQVDWWAQVMMVGCCAMILGCLAFKMNCEPYAGYCLKDYALIEFCTLWGIGHFVVHMLLLIYLVPLLGTEIEDDNQGMTFKAMAMDESKSWFNTNPVHCLRSKLIHKDEPYCRYSSVGKEHLLELNEKIGCHFKDEAAEVREMSFSRTVTDLKSQAGKMSRSLRTTSRPSTPDP